MQTHSISVSPLQMSQCVNADCSNDLLVVTASDSSPQTIRLTATTINFKIILLFSVMFNLLLRVFTKSLSIVIFFSVSDALKDNRSTASLSHTPGWPRQYIHTRPYKWELYVRYPLMSNVMLGSLISLWKRCTLFRNFRLSKTAHQNKRGWEHIRCWYWY